jgi:hypothetical protein
MDFLEAHKDEVEKAVFFSLAETCSTWTWT